MIGERAKQAVSILWSIVLLSLSIHPAAAINNTRTVNLTQAQVISYLNHPNLATAARYRVKDNAGNTMDAVSIIQVSGQAYKYAAVYHTPSQVAGGIRFKVSLAGSNDLINWTFIGILVDNASMAKIAHVNNSNWIILAHEQWLGAGQPSSAPSQIGYKLFYDANDLFTRTVRVSETMPQFVSNLNGTPSFYDVHLASYNGYYTVDGQYGFHFWDGSRDANAVTTILKLFSPSDPVINQPSTASAYNSSLIAQGVTGNIGDRDTLVTTAVRYNVQEGNVGQSGGSFDKWRLWLYTFGDGLNYPSGNGAWTALAPVTPAESISFGNPSITVVDRPIGTGKSLVIAYFIFAEGAGFHEAGTLIYYYNI